jgi:hypothetical protein
MTEVLLALGAWRIASAAPIMASCQRPALPFVLRGFLKAWFDTIAFMRANKVQTVKIAVDVSGEDAEIITRTYDELMPMFSDDGRFGAAALVLAKSYVELKVLPEAPDAAKLYAEALLRPK